MNTKEVDIAPQSLSFRVHLETREMLGNINSIIPRYLKSVGLTMEQADMVIEFRDGDKENLRVSCYPISYGDFSQEEQHTAFIHYREIRSIGITTDGSDYTYYHIATNNSDKHRTGPQISKITLIPKSHEQQN